MVMTLGSLTTDIVVEEPLVTSCGFVPHNGKESALSYLGNRT